MEDEPRKQPSGKPPKGWYWPGGISVTITGILMVLALAWLFFDLVVRGMRCVFP